MNIKGFTLIELLAVIIILAVVMLIGSSSISAVKRNIDRNLFERRLELVVAAGKKYGERDKNQFLDASTGRTNKVVYKNLGQLIATKDFETDESEVKSRVSNCTLEVSSEDGSEKRCAVVTNPVEGNIINDLTVKIYMDHNRVYACIPLTPDNKKIMYDTSCSRSGCSGNTCTWTNCEYADLYFYCVND